MRKEWVIIVPRSIERSTLSVFIKLPLSNLFAIPRLAHALRLVKTARTLRISLSNISALQTLRGWTAVLVSRPSTMTRRDRAHVHCFLVIIFPTKFFGTYSLPSYIMYVGEDSQAFYHILVDPASPNYPCGICVHFETSITLLSPIIWSA